MMLGNKLLWYRYFQPCIELKKKQKHKPHGWKNKWFYFEIENCSRALLLLKKKRLQENVIDQTLKQLDTIEKMVRMTLLSYLADSL